MMVFKISLFGRDSHTFSHATKEGSEVRTFFRHVIQSLHWLGFLDVPSGSKAKDESEEKKCKKIGIWLLASGRIGYLALVWSWTLLISVNIFYMAITTHDDGVQHGNMVVTFLEESPFALLTIRNAAVLTLFVAHGPQILTGVDSCESLRLHLCLLGGKVNFHRYRHRPLTFILSSFLVVLLFEIYEWHVWFGTSGMDYIWDFKPFPFSITQLQYAYCWWVFTSGPFFLAQLALCFPVLFAYVLRHFVRFVNKELRLLAEEAAVAESSNSPDSLDRLGDRVTQLRTAHFLIVQMVHKLDKAVNGMLLVQFICDVMIMFGFVGLLVNSKDAKPALNVLEWTFYIPASLTWLFFFLFHFSLPLIHLAEEGEKTGRLVYALTFSSTSLFQKKFKDLSLFLSEVKDTELAFTGAHFYYINRHYIVTVLALTASYLTVLTEILDRFYGTEDLKESVSMLARLITNDSKT